MEEKRNLAAFIWGDTLTQSWLWLLGAECYFLMQCMFPHQSMPSVLSFANIQPQHRLF